MILQQSGRFVSSSTPLLFVFLSTAVVQAESLTVYCDGSLPQADFALEEIRSALGTPVTQDSLSNFATSAGGERVILATIADLQVVTQLEATGARPPAGLKPEGFSIRTTGTGNMRTCWILGADAAGLMYGGLEFAEIARKFQPVIDKDNVDFLFSFKYAKAHAFSSTYLEPDGSPENSIQWTFDAPAAGTYVLELRYAHAGPEERSLEVQVNGDSAGPLVAWNSGGESTWGWDRMPVKLVKGANRIGLLGTRFPAVDLLNALETEE